MKNVAVDSGIIPQVLEYAIWAESNPDSVKALWLECEDKPEDVEIEWESTHVRILVIAPSIAKSTLDYVGKINYAVELIEVTRWIEEESQFLLVHPLERKRKASLSTVRGLAQHNLDFYKKQFNAATAIKFMHLLRRATEIR